MTIGYTRLSFDKYDDQLGVTRQREDITALARSLGWPDVTEFYEDNDVSANADKKKPRPAFERLLHDMRTGAVTHVLCYDQDRLVRDMRQLEDVVDAVEAGHVMLTSVNGDIDLLTDNGRMVARIKAAVARNELERLSRRSRRQKLQRAQRGMKNQGINRTYGFTRQFEVVPEEAAVLVELFRRKLQGERVSSLTRWLNAAGIPSSRGGIWHQSVLRYMLQRPEYTGDVTFNGEVVATGALPQIIDRETFDRVSCTVGKPRDWLTAPDMGLLNGLLVCGMCGGKMKRGRGRSTVGEYVCSTHTATNDRLCLTVAVDRDIVAAVRAKVHRVQEKGASVRRDSAQAVAIEHEIAQVRQSYARGELTRASMDVVIQHLRSRLAQEQRVTGAAADGARPVLWDTWDLNTQRSWLAQWVDHIHVAKPGRTPAGAHVRLGRVTIHYLEGESEVLDKPPVTLKDVGRLAGCDHETAGRALNGTGVMRPETRARVRAAAEELGYDLRRLASYQRAAKRAPS